MIKDNVKFAPMTHEKNSQSDLIYMKDIGIKELEQSRGGKWICVCVRSDILLD